MVGYNKDDQMTTNQKLIAGCISGVFTRFVTQPMDVLKVRTQLMQKRQSYNKKWFGVTRKILNEEGVMAFWHGHNLGQIYSITAVSSQFFFYELTTKYVEKTQQDNRYKQLLVFCSGILAGCCSTALVIPLEVIRVRQILVKGKYAGMFNGAKEVYNTGGILAFYEGLSASLLQMGPQVGISFCVFRYTQPLILNYFGGCNDANCDRASGHTHNAQHLMIASTAGGLTAGFVSKTVTYPFDLAKRRLQIASHLDDGKHWVPSTSKKLIKCRRLVECLVKAVKHEGLLGLYRGWNVTILKATLTSIVTFTTYELVCHAIMDMNFAKK